MKKRWSCIIIFSIIVSTVLFSWNALTLAQQTESTQEAPSTGSSVKQNSVFSKIIIKPVDEGLKNPDFKAFRNKLLTAIQQKDLAFLKKHLDENIQYSFGDDEPGAKGFLKAWDLDKDPSRSKFWGELKRVLSMGGGFEKDGTYTAPYYFQKFPTSEEFDITDFVVIQKDVKIYIKPNRNSDVVGTISYEVVRFNPIQSNDTNGWQSIVTWNGIQGFIESRYLGCPMDFRAGFKNVNGNWKMIFFIAGD